MNAEQHKIYLASKALKSHKAEVLKNLKHLSSLGTLTPGQQVHKLDLALTVSVLNKIIGDLK